MTAQIDENPVPEAGQVEEATEAPKAAPVWPMAGYPTIRLAREVRTTENGNETVYRRPVTVSAEVNFGQGFSVHFPDLAMQEAGFIPYRLGKDGVPEDATGIVLETFRGVGQLAGHREESGPHSRLFAAGPNRAGANQPHYAI
jgi:hypothetical protein